MDSLASVAVPARVFPGHFLRSVSRPFVPEEGQVYVWFLHLDDFATESHEVLLGACLDVLDRDRMHTYRARTRRRQFLLGRAALRRLLSSVLSCPAAWVRLCQDHHGKPLLATGPYRHRDVHFNLSHSGDWVCLALTRDMPVGIDIERVDVARDGLRLSRRFFSRSEQTAIRLCADTGRAFHHCWVRKESFVKGVARGLGLGLEHFSVSVADQSRATPVVLSPERPIPLDINWFNYAVAAPSGYVAALALPVAQARVCHLPFPGGMS